MRTSLLLALTPLMLPLVACSPSTADDKVVNTPTIIAGMKGTWQLESEDASFAPTLTLDGSRSGHWHQSRETLPVSITFYVEGGELLIQHYYEPNHSFNYRLKQHRFAYELDEDTLVLKNNSETLSWKRVRVEDTE